MRRQIIDPELRFACTNCGDCCIKPWCVPVGEGTADAIRRFDWGAKYPALADRAIVESQQSSRGTRYVLTKAADGSCIFHDHAARRCLLHAELGAEAKPHTCRQYPFLAAPAPDGDRVYALFSCEAVRVDNGPRLVDQRESIASIVTSTPGWERPDVPLTQSRAISIDACNQLADRMADQFAADTIGDLWDRFANAVGLVVAVCRGPVGDEEATIRSSGLGSDVTRPPLSGFASLQKAPLTPRILLGVNLWSDMFPPHSLGRRIPLRRRASMIMKLMQIVQFRGSYASRLLERNVPLRALDRADLVAPIPGSASELLRRWIRSCLVGRSFVVNDLSMLAGLHELILDFSAVVFMARAQAVGTGRPPTEEMYATALTRVTSHVTAQRRLYRLVFPSWMLANLESPDAAWSSLRLLHPERSTADTPVRDRDVALQART